MSLVSLVIRTAVAKILTGSTLCGDRVYDAPISPIEDVYQEGAEAHPVIAVYTSSGKKDDITGRDLRGARADLDLTIHAYSPHEVVLPSGVRIGGKGIAAVLDVIERQVEAAFAQDDTVWGKTFRRMVPSIAKVQSSRVFVSIGTPEGGVAIPLAEMTYTLKTVLEPGYGAPMDALWASIEQDIRADAQMTDFADLIKACAEEPGNLLDWRRMQALGAMTFGEVRNIGLTPLSAIEEEAAPELVSITIDGGAP